MVRKSQGKIKNTAVEYNLTIWNFYIRNKTTKRLVSKIYNSV